MSFVTRYLSLQKSVQCNGMDVCNGMYACHANETKKTNVPTKSRHSKHILNSELIHIIYYNLSWNVLNSS